MENKNEVVMKLYCGGREGMDVYINSEFIGFVEAPDDALEKFFVIMTKKLDLTKPINFIRE